VLNNLRPALVVARREVRDQFRDWRIIGPVFLLAIIFPSVMNYAAGQLIQLAQRYGARVEHGQLVPFLLMVVGFFPVTVSLVIALESFVGEKERRSIEPLLTTPLSDLQLYLGKLLAAMVPPLLASYLGMAMYILSLYRQGNWLPAGAVFAQIAILTAVNCLVMVSGAVVVSSQTTSMRGANLLAAFIILPMAMLLQGQSIVITWARPEVLWWTIFGQVIIAVLLIRTGVAHFNREELLGREFDVLDLRWGWYTFWGAFLGQARSPLDWYRKDIRATLHRLALPLVLMILVLAGALLLGANLSGRFTIPAELFERSALDKGTIQGLDYIRFFEVGSVPIVWLHNLRAIFLATLMGIVSFGVLALMILLAPFMLTGYFMAAFASAGLSPWAFLLAFVLPHGVLEVPAIILAGAAILRLGATLAAPARGQTIGEAWLGALADWTRVMVALVLPLLLGAALLEVMLTPHVALWILGS
jgi:ABC-type transport system involved in multi-copper enzyme maturation permease subunit